MQRHDAGSRCIGRATASSTLRRGETTRERGARTAKGFVSAEAMADPVRLTMVLEMRPSTPSTLTSCLDSAVEWQPRLLQCRLNQSLNASVAPPVTPRELVVHHRLRQPPSPTLCAVARKVLSSWAAVDLQSRNRGDSVVQASTARMFRFDPLLTPNESRFGSVGLTRT